MAAYVMVEVEIYNMEAVGPYVTAVDETIAAHGGKFMIRLGDIEVIEGGVGEYPLKTVIEFPSAEDAKSWYESPEYQAIVRYRTDNSKCNFLIVQGV